jgi:hypothetical protein
MSQHIISRFGYLERANLITTNAIIRREFPDTPILTANMLFELSDGEIQRLREQLMAMLRSMDSN